MIIFKCLNLCYTILIENHFIDYFLYFCHNIRYLHKVVKKINIKGIVSILASKFTIFLTKTLLKGGTTFPGKVALKIDKNILSKVSKGYKVILVTGTNGKTTTTNMIYNIIKTSGKKVITNNTGANLYPE